MKNVLDHRILIPRPPQTVWKYISDVSNNPNWQTDCEAISYLTSRRTGVGVRWRYQTTAGHDCVVETTAWYDGLGYEYSYIDGVPYEENRGRIRLQEIPEGTVVQWTFSYDTKGFISGVRNTLTLRRQTESIMIDSLRMLWKKLNQSGLGEPIREAKSLIREAPDYEQRSRYKPRHPSKADLETPAAAPKSESLISEPPLTDEDTRPSARATVPAEQDVSKPGDKPDIPVAEMQPATPVVETVPQTELPIEAEHAPVLQAAVSEPEVMPEGSPVSQATDEGEPEKPLPAAPQMPAHAEATTVHEQPSHEGEADRSAETVKTPVVEAQLQDSAGSPTPATSREPIPPEKLAAMDTREVSVFEIFGLPKPSETQESLPVVPPVAQSETRAEVPAVRRVGLRIILRRKLVKLRRPV